VRDFSPPLSRANTFPGEGSPTSNPASPSRPLGSTTSLPLVLPPKSNRPISPSKPLSRHGSTLLNFSEPPPRQAPVAGSKRTYGGARSFRRDTDEESLFSISSIRSDAASTTSSRKLPSLPPMRQRERISYATARAAQDSDELLEASLGGVTELKTVTQLRAKGENARFADEFDYLVEGLEPGCELSSRRSSAIEVLRKVGDGEFMRRLKASGFVERTYLEFRRADAGNGDRVSLVRSKFVNWADEGGFRFSTQRWQSSLRLSFETRGSQNLSSESSRVRFPRAYPTRNRYLRNRRAMSLRCWGS
jgi:hypothetical protein